MSNSIKKTIIPFFIPHMGCPHQCVFCNQQKITGQRTPLTPLDIRNYLQQQLQSIASDAQGEIAFYGGSFTALPWDLQEEYLDCVQDFLNPQGPLSSLRISTRPDAISAPILKNLRQYQVKTVELGVQSMDDTVLQASLRGHDSRCVQESVKLLRSFDMAIGLQMMVGLPKDSIEKSIFTAKAFIDLQPNFVRIYPALVIQNTPMEAMWRSGEYVPWPLENMLESVKILHLLFSYHHIPIIRTGLQSTESISMHSEALLAGPYHPAFGELVLSLQYRDLLVHGAAAFSGDDVLNIDSDPKIISQLMGHHRCNALYLEQVLKKKLVVRGDESLPQGAIRIQKQLLLKQQEQLSLLYSLYQKFLS